MKRPPTPEEWEQLQQVQPCADAVRLARELAGHTQSQAGEAVHSDGRSWRRWETGAREMHPSMWELYRIKALGFVPINKKT